MILPIGASTFEEALQMGSETYHHLKVILFIRTNFWDCNFQCISCFFLMVFLPGFIFRYQFPSLMRFFLIPSPTPPPKCILCSSALNPKSVNGHMSQSNQQTSYFCKLYMQGVYKHMKISMHKQITSVQIQKVRHLPDCRSGKLTKIHAQLHYPPLIEMV